MYRWRIAKAAASIVGALLLVYIGAALENGPTETNGHAAELAAMLGARNVTLEHVRIVLMVAALTAALWGVWLLWALMGEWRQTRLAVAYQQEALQEGMRVRAEFSEAKRAATAAEERALTLEVENARLRGALQEAQPEVTPLTTSPAQSAPNTQAAGARRTLAEAARLLETEPSPVESGHANTISRPEPPPQQAEEIDGRRIRVVATDTMLPLLRILEPTAIPGSQPKDLVLEVENRLEHPISGCVAILSRFRPARSSGLSQG